MVELQTQCSFALNVFNALEGIQVPLPQFSQTNKYRPYTVFQIELKSILNSWNYGKYKVPISWQDPSDGNKLAETYYTFYIMDSEMKNISLLDYDNSDHEALTSLSFVIKTGRKFTKFDSFEVEMIGFTLNPEEYTSTCTIVINSELATIPTCLIDSENSIVNIENFPEDISEFELNFELIENPHTNAIYFLNISWYNEEDLLDFNQLELFFQFTSFSFLPEGSTYNSFGIVHFLQFQYKEAIEAGWNILI